MGIDTEVRLYRQVFRFTQLHVGPIAVVLGDLEVTAPPEGFQVKEPERKVIRKAPRRKRKGWVRRDLDNEGEDSELESPKGTLATVNCVLP
jgi:hypothetical protein